MVQREGKLSRGFTVVEITVGVLILGVIAAFAAPRITNAMREYRLNVGIRQLSDLIQRAKMQAVSENKKTTLRVDTANNRAGLVIYDTSGNEVRTDYVQLPSGVTFSRPVSLTEPMSGAPTSRSVSFPAQSGSSTVFQQDFNSRGFPVVATAGAINAIYLGNTRTYRALTLSSVGGIGMWTWSNTQWVNTRAAATTNPGLFFGGSRLWH